MELRQTDPEARQVAIHIDLANPHRRALYSHSDDWVGQWLAP